MSRLTKKQKERERIACICEDIIRNSNGAKQLRNANKLVEERKKKLFKRLKELRA